MTKMQVRSIGLVALLALSAFLLAASPKNVWLECYVPRAALTQTLDQEAGGRVGGGDQARLDMYRKIAWTSAYEQNVAVQVGDAETVNAFMKQHGFEDAMPVSGNMNAAALLKVIYTWDKGSAAETTPMRVHGKEYPVVRMYGSPNATLYNYDERDMVRISALGDDHTPVLVTFMKLKPGDLARGPWELATSETIQPVAQQERFDIEFPMLYVKGHTESMPEFLNVLFKHSPVDRATQVTRVHVDHRGGGVESLAVLETRGVGLTYDPAPRVIKFGEAGAPFLYVISKPNTRTPAMAMYASPENAWGRPPLR
ncbi:MAG: hypothetical protein AB7N91_16580 [Candidatus Tectimicrobiota bacterium]